MRYVIVLLAMILAGCSAAAPLRPEAVFTKMDPVDWPRNAVTVVVDDRRHERLASAEMIAAIDASIRQALAPARATPCPCYTFKVAVLEHAGFAPGGGSAFWHGQTTLQATLIDADGRGVYRFAAEDHDEQWNAWGRSSGTLAAQQSLRDALRKLVRQMAARPFPPFTTAAPGAAQEK
jgi:hypothetical protein